MLCRHALPCSILSAWASICRCIDPDFPDDRVNDTVSSADHNRTDLFSSMKYPEDGVPVLNRKIFRGYRVAINEHPYVVSIRRLGCHYLVGTLLTKTTVIAVAHPIYNVPVMDLGVTAGENYSDRGSTMRIVALVTVPNDFDPYTLRNDIALLVVFPKYTYTLSVYPVGLIKPKSKLLFKRAFVTGWGRCDFTGKELCLPRSTIYYPDEKIDPMLRTVNFIVKKTNSNCEGYKKLDADVYDGMVCFGVAREDDGGAACMGVPGAPLVVDGRLVGLQSWGFSCGYTRDLPVVYTDIDFHRRWIEHNIAILNIIADSDNMANMVNATKILAVTNALVKTRIKKIVLKNKVTGPLAALDIDHEMVKMSGQVFDFRNYFGSESQRNKYLLYQKLTKHKRFKANNRSKVSPQPKSLPFLTLPAEYEMHAATESAMASYEHEAEDSQKQARSHAANDGNISASTI